METETWLVTATPPTPNGDLHLGHLCGPYLAADIFRRHLRQLGADVIAVTGIDDHQTYTEARGIRDGKTAETTAQWFGNRIVEAWANAQVDFDIVTRPILAPYHRALTQNVFRKLFEQGDIVARVKPLPYCSTCERWAYEAYVTGECPHCGAQSCGNACESCGRPNDCGDLKSPRCTICLSECETRLCERLYFPLSRHVDTLRLFVSDARMSGHLRALSESMIAIGLPEIAVSHPAEWGIDVPIDKFKSHRIYVWFEMAAGYLAAGGSEHTVGAWHTRRRVIQFLGIDNGYFHSLLFPAIMRAFDVHVPLPTAFVTNEFYRLDGLKFSTSRNHAIWLSEALERVPADHLRLYLSWDRPAVSQTNFRWEHFYARVHGELLPRWYSWLTSLAQRCKIAASIISNTNENVACPLAITNSHRRWIGNALENVHEAYSLDRFSPRMALQQLDLLVEASAEAGRDSEHLAAHAALQSTFVRGVVDELATAVALAIGLFPIAPMMASQLWSIFGCSGQVEDARWNCLDAYLPRSLTNFDVDGFGSLFVPAATASQGRDERPR